MLFIYEVCKQESYTFILVEGKGEVDPRFKKEDGWVYMLVQSFGGDSGYGAFDRLVDFEEKVVGGCFFRS